MLMCAIHLYIRSELVDDHEKKGAQIPVDNDNVVGGGGGKDEGAPSEYWINSPESVATKAKCTLTHPARSLCLARPLCLSASVVCFGLALCCILARTHALFLHWRLAATYALSIRMQLSTSIY